MLKHKKETILWSKSAHRRSPIRVPASTSFLQFRTYFSLSSLFRACRLHSRWSLVSCIFTSNLGSVDNLTSFGLPTRRVSLIILHFVNNFGFAIPPILYVVPALFLNTQFYCYIKFLLIDYFQCF